MNGGTLEGAESITERVPNSKAVIWGERILLKVLLANAIGEQLINTNILITLWFPRPTEMTDILWMQMQNRGNFDI